MVFLHSHAHHRVCCGAIASIPLVVYSIIMNPEILSGGTNNILAVTNTNLGLALMLFTFAGGVVALLLCVKYFHHKKPTDILRVEIALT